MVSPIQDLSQMFPIVDPETGCATDYLMRLLKVQKDCLLMGMPAPPPGFTVDAR